MSSLAPLMNRLLSIILAGSLFPSPLSFIFTFHTFFSSPADQSMEGLILIMHGSQVPLNHHHPRTVFAQLKYPRDKWNSSRCRRTEERVGGSLLGVSCFHRPVTVCQFICHHLSSIVQPEDNLLGDTLSFDTFRGDNSLAMTFFFTLPTYSSRVINKTLVVFNVITSQ